MGHSSLPPTTMKTQTAVTSAILLALSAVDLPALRSNSIESFDTQGSLEKTGGVRTTVPKAVSGQNAEDASMVHKAEASYKKGDWPAHYEQRSPDYYAEDEWGHYEEEWTEAEWQAWEDEAHYDGWYDGWDESYPSGKDQRRKVEECAPLNRAHSDRTCSRRQAW